jgi:hypothetical protein
MDVLWNPIRNIKLKKKYVVILWDCTDEIRTCCLLRIIRNCNESK